MKQLLVVWTLLSCLLVSCGSRFDTGAGNDGPADLGTFTAGEPVTFRIEDTVHVCTDELAYAIVQITDSGTRRLMLQHSCIGIVGRGIDQFCENGQVRTEDVRTCSDAIFCEDQRLDLEVVWDQQEYVQIGEACAGQTIHREVNQQVSAGRYQIVVQDWKEDHIENRIIAELTIMSE
jgi:hypothetical protein